MSIVNKPRCLWCNDDPLYIEYHDNEWGVPVYDESKLFEMLLLETFQSGLSWITILKKRESFRKAFDNFNIKKIANYRSEKLEQLQNNKGIIRNKSKINAAKNNASAFINVQQRFGGFSEYIWQFTNKKPILNRFRNLKELPSKTNLSYKISHDLKKQGFQYIGPTTTYAYMQAIGIVNDHTSNCFKYENS